MSKYLTEMQLDDIVSNVWDVSDAETQMNEESDDDLSDIEVQSKHSDHDTDTEVCSDNEEISVTESREYFYGRNCYKWLKVPPPKIRAKTIAQALPALHGAAARNKPSTPFGSWLLFITDEILDIIIEHTNYKITQVSSMYGTSATFINHVDKLEMTAFLGLLYLSGIFKSANEDANSLWATDGTGREIFRHTMSMKRFMFLLGVLRFDDAETREERKTNGDKLAPISEVFEKFINNCKNNYSPYPYMTVDEMLVGFKGKCSFRGCMKGKAQQYGLKIICLCDSKTRYLLNASVYTTKNANSANPKKLSIPTLTILDLVTPIVGTNRTITGDSWFTSMELLQELKEKRLTYVGTIRKNKKEIPPQFLPNKCREVNSSIFGFTQDFTMVSFVPSRNHSVNLVSSLHHDQTINDISKMPEILEFYNCTKGGVDSIDQKCAIYSCNRRTKCWPLAIFYVILNIAAINSHIILSLANTNLKMRRREFLKELGMAMIEVHMKRRCFTMHMPREIRQKIRELQNIPDNFIDKEVPPIKRRRCKECPSNLDRKHSTYCMKCYKTICKQHSIQQIYCLNCNEDS